MITLEKHHIVDLFVWVDDALPKSPPSARGGRPLMLQHSELITMLIWNAVVLHQHTLKDIHSYVRMHLTDEFPRLPSYQTFVRQCHRVTPLMCQLLEKLLCTEEPFRLVDATMIPVCTLKRAERHKVAKNIANFGKNHQGWHYGFKLHASTAFDGKLCQIMFTPASIYDAQMLPAITNKHTRLAVGDTLYGASVMKNKLWKEQGTFVLAPPWPTQKKKIIAPWQHQLLNWRSKIEAVFDVLKEHLHLVTSFPRSAYGYLVHYVRILLGYQIIALSCER
jgi:hypothetical protein